MAAPDHRACKQCGVSIGTSPKNHVRCLKCWRKSIPQVRCVYWLTLEHGCFYVGQTTLKGLSQRFEDHKRGIGAAWTSAHKPLLVGCKVVDPNTAGLYEDLKTKELMQIHGIDKVRGGSYCEVDLPACKVDSLKLELAHNRGACFRCGREDHLANVCHLSNKVQ